MKRINSPWGIDPDPGQLRWNTNSGACAINLAVHFGVKKIVLLGFDMQRVEGKNNWHQDYPRATTTKKAKEIYDPYPHMLEAFSVIAQDLRALGIETLNVTEAGALEVFSRIKLEDLFA